MLDLMKYFAVGDKIQINYVDILGRRNEYISQVVEIVDNEFLDVLVPIHKNHNVYLKQDTVLNVVIAKGEAVYEFKTVLYEKLFGRIPLLRLRVLSEVNKIQRRDFFRLKVMMNIEARLVLDLKQRQYGEAFKCNLHDISAGGVLISTSKELEKNDMLELPLVLNGKKLIVFGIIIRRTLTDNSKAPNAYGLKYDRMSDFERNEINKFIFEEQRRLIKKGLV
jgi:c-di-GMP-binding flagellar brake protein YcgR